MEYQLRLTRISWEHNEDLLHKDEMISALNKLVEASVEIDTFAGICSNLTDIIERDRNRVFDYYLEMALRRSIVRVIAAIFGDNCYPFGESPGHREDLWKDGHRHEWCAALFTLLTEGKVFLDEDLVRYLDPKVRSELINKGLLAYWPTELGRMR